MKFANIINTLPKIGRGWPKRRLESITDITVHHSATALNHTPLNFARYHTGSASKRLPANRRGKGWPAIGYHFVITPDGTVNQCLPMAAWSNHNGYNNGHALGVCLVGNFEEHDPTAWQMAALDELIDYLKIKLPRIKNLMGHREYPVRQNEFRTLCPGKFLSIVPLRERHELGRHTAADITH